MRLKRVDRFWAFFLQGGRCILCGEPIDMSLPVHTYGSPTFEHKTPLSLGGAAWRYNLAISHYECNCHRGARLGLKFIRPEKEPIPLEPGRRPLVPMCGIWHSHFRLPVTDPRWELPEQRERMLRRLGKP